MRDLLDADQRLYRVLHSRARAGWIDPIMIWLTRAGTKGAVWLGLAAGILIVGSPHARWVAAASAASLLLAEVSINLVLKPIVRRKRPFTRTGHTALLVKAPGPHSWPSAHAGSSLAAAAVLAYGYPLWSPFLITSALLIGYSRVYVGVHYPLDIGSGFAVGLVCATLIVGLSLTVAHTVAIASLPL